MLRSYDRKWTKPLVLLINNRSYSDAEIFPNAFRTLGLGKLVGQPTGGYVIGTVERPADRRLDRSASRASACTRRKGVNMEKEGVRPDVLVETHPDQLAKGIDAQLDKAVEVLQGTWSPGRNRTRRSPPAPPSPNPPGRRPRRCRSRSSQKDRRQCKTIRRTRAHGMAPAFSLLTSDS